MILDAVSNVVGIISGFMYSKLLIVLLIGGGLYFTLATRFVQLRMFRESLRVIMEKPTEKEGVSSFQALMVSTASRVGTGNIVGVATAICLGGYGSVFWMWIIAAIGGASAFIESTLAQIYKKQDPKNGHFYGGPSYYIEQALHSRALGFIFALSMLLTYAGGFNMLCAYNLQSTFSAYSFYDPKLSPVIIGGVLALVFGYTLFGGDNRIIKTASTLVPFMGVIYIVTSLIVLLLNAQAVPAVFARIFREAFDFQAIGAGFMGSCVMFGIKRGLYSNEAGVGSAPNAAAAAAVSHPVKQGLVQMLSVFIDTLLLCTATALMCLCSGAVPDKELAGAPYVQEAMRAALGSFGPIFLTVAMILFAFTTLIGNFYYTENLVIYMLKKIPEKSFSLWYRLVCTVIVFIGTISRMGLLWDISDVLMGIMAIINIPVILILSRVALAALRDYDRQKREDKNPEFHAETVGLEGKVDCWK